MKGLSVRVARGDEGAALAALASKTFRETFEADNDPQDLAMHLARAYSPEVQGRELADPDIRTVVVDGPDRTLVAYSQVRRIKPPDAVTGALPVEIWRFYVDRPYQGTGLAQSLMTAALDSAGSMGGRTVWLGVWERNARALAFYTKFGFTDVGSHTFIVGTDPQRDRLLALDLEVTRLVKAFLGCTLPRAAWTHRAHLCVGLWHARRFAFEDALARVRTGIQRYNASHGVESSPGGGYHETLTVLYMRLVAAWAASHPRPYVDEADLDALYAGLGGRSLPLTYYTRDRLFSDAARREWVEPDLQPCP